MTIIRLHVNDFTKEKTQELLELGVLEKRRVALQYEEQVCIEGYWVDDGTLLSFNLKEVIKHIDKVINSNIHILFEKSSNSCRIELCDSRYPTVLAECDGREISLLHEGLKIPNQLKITIG